MPEFTQSIKNSTFSNGKPAGVSAVTRDNSGRLSSWVENGFACSVKRDSSGNPIVLTARDRHNLLQQTLSFDANGRLVKTGGDSIPTALLPELGIASTIAAERLAGVLGQPITAIAYSGGQISSYVQNGVTYTLGYNADGSINTVSDGTTTRTVTYNSDGSVASYA